MPDSIATALQESRRRLAGGSTTPYLDAQLLLMEVLGVPRAWLLTHSELALDNSQHAEFEAKVAAVEGGAALPHVLGWWDFYGRRFQLSPEVLIPRPETELLVEVALALATPNASILDLGTGCGCIAVTLALELHEARIVASDLSGDALRVAQGNAEDYGVDGRISPVQADLLSSFSGPLDLICANLPYISTEELQVLPVGTREPKLALDGGRGGLELIIPALRDVPRVLAPGGTALFEIDPRQSNQLREQEIPGAEIVVEQDLAGQDRLLVISGG